MTRIIYARCARAAKLLENDVMQPLLVQSRLEVAEIERYLAPIEISAIFSSDYKRALETMKGLGLQRRLPVHADIRLRKGRLGFCLDLPKPASGAEERSIARRMWEDLDFSYEGSESIHEIQKRNIALLEETLCAYDGKTVVICTHGICICTVMNFYDPTFLFKQVQQSRQRNPWILDMEFTGSSLASIKTPFA